MNTFTIKNTEYEKVVLTTYENSVTIQRTEGYKSKTTSTTHESIDILNIDVDTINIVQYKQAVNTTESGNQTKMMGFLIGAIICFVLFLIFIGGKTPIVGVVLLIAAIICAINAVKNKPQSEKKTGAEFSLYDINGKKIYSIQTLLSTEVVNDIIASIRVIQH